MFSTLIVLTALAVTAQATTFNISIYYESLCPDSKRFITTQFYPVFEKIPEYINAEFIPYGNAHVTEGADGGLNFTCQHGPGECYGNEVQGCAIHIDEEKSVDFIDCAMASDDASNDANLENCSEVSGIPWRTIESCMTNGLAERLFVENGAITDALDPPLAFVPTIIFNGVYDDALQEAAQNDFLNTACELLKEEPALCTARK